MLYLTIRLLQPLELKAVHSLLTTLALRLMLYWGQSIEEESNI